MDKDWCTNIKCAEQIDNISVFVQVTACCRKVSIFFHGANMGLTWVLSAPGEPHVGPMDLAIREQALESLLSSFVND